ncbi:hypothetical protein QZM82_13310 [Burkholderia cepacia]|uniref:hypothetical protein n=1 Tax=Burkholderia cepacia TaxID=292 RepID=UPI002650D9A5|nr:hypothetical protein [Burkholderia cepacia]MDN7897169.1 hypothetical protein [Burkholderia cepacia]
MSEIKSTPGSWPIERDRNVITSIGPIVPEEYAGAVWLDVSEQDALVASAAPDMLMVLELLAAEADAGKVMIPSGLRLTIDAALIKAGRKAAPEPVRVVTIAGGAR